MRSTTYYNRRRFFFAPVAIIIFAILSAVIMALWNIIMPVIFNLPSINFWQAVGLFVLARLLFGGFRHFNGWHHHPWRHNLKEKLSKMTPEEKEIFFKNLHNYRRYCYNGPHNEDEKKTEDK